jgi:RNA polymerase sigma factor (sigma-70 family)
MDYKNILALIDQKDKKGLEALYTLYGTKFYQFAVNKWELNEDEAWDVIYKTLETLVLKLPEYAFESQAHFDNFIFKVFVNYLRQYFRSHRKHQYDIVYVDFTQQESENDTDASRDGADGPAEPDPFRPIPIDDHVFNEVYEVDIADSPRLSLLKQALAQLDHSDQQLLMLRAQNYSYDEIAQFLQIENNQLKVRHLRCKNKLKKLFLKLLTDDHAKAK